MKIALFGKSFSPEYRNEISELFTQLRQRECIVFCETHFAEYLCSVYGCCLNFDGYYDKNNFLSFKPDLLMSIGGDGTFLDAIAYVRDSEIPMIGINIGRLGFLANIAVNEKQEALDAILKGSYTIEKRDVIAITINDKPLSDFDYALNEVSIAKPDTASLLTIHTYIDGDYLTSYWADGLVVATPTGSTAYSLSGGGPIVTPECPNFILTPICPHNLNLRSLVVSNQVDIELQIESRSGDYILGMDSRFYKLSETTKLHIKRGPFQIHTLKLHDHNYYRTLRNKMMWGEDRRNR